MLKYKSAIRHAIYEHENPRNDELFDQFMNKRIPEFWKSWSSKFHRNVTKNVDINGFNSELVISNAFADHFSFIYSTSYNDLDAKRDFKVCVLRSQFIILVILVVNVESVTRFFLAPSI